MVRPPGRLSVADRECLAQAIKTGEARSSAELVLVIADSCGFYGVFGLLWPALAALLAGAVLALGAPQLAASRLFLAEAGIFAVLAALLQWPAALMRLVPPQVRRAHARHVAAHQFELRVEGRTPARTGVMLFLAMAERQVIILADSGVSAVIDGEAWRDIVDRLGAARRTGPPVDALAAAIGEILALLERHFPRDIDVRGTDGTEARGTDAGGALPDEIVELSAGSQSDRDIDREAGPKSG